MLLHAKTHRSLSRKYKSESLPSKISPWIGVSWVNEKATIFNRQKDRNSRFVKVLHPPNFNIDTKNDGYVWISMLHFGGYISKQHQNIAFVKILVSNTKVRLLWHCSKTITGL